MSPAVPLIKKHAIAAAKPQREIRADIIVVSISPIGKKIFIMNIAIGTIKPTR